MGNGKQIDDTDDRLVGKRGAQGDAWHWGDATPPNPGEHPPGWTPADSVGEVRRILQRMGGWFASSFETVRKFFNTPHRAPEWPPSDAKTPAAEQKAPSEASPGVADTESASISTPDRPLRTLGSAITRPRMPGVRPKEAPVPQDSGSPLLILASIGLAAAIVIGVIIAVGAIGGGDGNGLVAEVTATPKTTLIPPASETPSPTAQTGGRPPETPSPTPSKPASATPSVTPTRTPVRTATATPAPPTPPLPQGAVAAAFWANTSNAWWFGAMSGSAARYEEGQEVPLLVQWDGVAGQTYQVRITYDCAVGDVLGAIDYLSGTQSWGRSIVYAKYGPAKEQPDAAVLSPNTPGFIPDDQNAGVISLYGGKFTVLPEEPSPSGACPGRRTVSLPVEASGGRVTVLASGHLGVASIYGPGKGAAGATSALAVIASVDGVGTASASIDASVIADVEN